MDLNEKRSVSWVAVIGGLLAAWVTGIFVGAFAVVGSAAVFAEPKMSLLAIVVATVAVFLFYLALFWICRRHARDLAMGILIGGCMVAIVAGACGALLSRYDVL